jgi:hypothetical protein
MRTKKKWEEQNELNDTNKYDNKVRKAVKLHAMEVLDWGGSIAPTHSRPRH